MLWFAWDFGHPPFWIVTRNQYGISTLVSQTSFRGEIIGGVAKYRLFSQASVIGAGYDFWLRAREANAECTRASAKFPPSS